MAQLKDQLIEFIDAYAIARSTGNACLINLSTNTLNSFLSKTDIILVDTEKQVLAAAEDEEQKPVSQAKNKRIAQ